MFLLGILYCTSKFVTLFKITSTICYLTISNSVHANYSINFYIRYTAKIQTSVDNNNQILIILKQPFHAQHSLKHMLVKPVILFTTKNIKNTILQHFQRRIQNHQHRYIFHSASFLRGLYLQSE